MLSAGHVHGMIEHFQHAQSNREHCDGIYIRMRDLIANQNRRYSEYGHGSALNPGLPQVSHRF
jgi:hypothetical protein